MRLCAAVVVLLAVLPAGVAGAHPEAREESRLMRLFGQEDLARQAPPARASQAAGEQAPAATPRAECGPGSRPEPGMQGRIPAGAPGREQGFTCNTELVGHVESGGGYKALRYVDKAGRECAYYDTTLLFPTNALNLSESPTGVAVLDMTDPANPVRTDSLLTPAMQTPHESLLLNQRRGLIAAVMGNPTTAPGVVDLYDASEDCRHPVLRSSTPLGYLGHESGFAPDGNTFYATSLFSGDVTALDVTNPSLPSIVWQGRYGSHGLTVSDDGNRLYLADRTRGLVIVDSSEIQARKPDPQARDVGELRWPNMTIPQVAHPVTIGGRPYIVEVDEFSSDEDGFPQSHGDRVGAARIIDISDETRPRVVSDLRLEVNQPETRAETAGDPGTDSPVQGYAGHYCNVPQRAEPGIVACSFIASGLRIFDIRDPERPKELGYFVAPAAEGANYAMSSPEFVPERGEVWYTDGDSGFYTVRMTNGVWPFGDPSSETGGAGGACIASEGFRAVGARPSGGDLRLRFERRTALPVRIDVFRVSSGRRVVREQRVASFTRPTDWRPGRLADGYYFVRFSMLSGGDRVDVQRIVLRRARGRWSVRPGHHRRASCGLLRQFKLERPVFGPTALRGAYRLSRAARVSVVVLRGRRVVRRFAAAQRAAGRTYRFAIPARRLPAGDYRVRLTAGGVTATLVSRRL